MTYRRRSARVHQRGAQTRHMRRGFTVVSMLVAMILLGVGMMSLAGANAQTVTMQALAQNRTSAIALARAYLEQVRTRDPWTIQSESAVLLASDGTPSATGAFTRTMNVTVTRNNLIQIIINVTYPRGAQPVKLTTSLFRGNGLSAAP